MTTQDGNIAASLTVMADKQPYAKAIVFPHGRSPDGKVSYIHYTYAQLEHESNAIARGLVSVGVGKGVRTALMVKPSLELFALTFALFKAGAVPVMIDPGIGMANIKKCLQEAKPEAFIGIPSAQIARILFRWANSSLRTIVTVGAGVWPLGYSLQQIKQRGLDKSDTVLEPTQRDDMAAILFTSGSTGVPKGAVYLHEHFLMQVEMIRKTYHIEPQEIDLPTFPLFALFDPALGMTSVIPDMDFTRPAQVNPVRLLEAIENFGITNMFGSPALLTTFGRYLEAHGISLPTLKRIVSAGAPVAPKILRCFHKALNSGVEIFTPYGATEALPVSSIGSAQILSETSYLTDKGHGVCVGEPVANNDVRIIAIRDEVITNYSFELELAPGKVGEITVAGPTVTQAYYNRPEQTSQAKMIDADGRVRHRMGDLGYFDAQGRLWFCGRKAHRVRLEHEEMYTVPCEAVFNTHPEVFRTALVGVPGAKGRQAVLCVELEPSCAKTKRQSVKQELLQRAQKFEHTVAIKTILFHPGFPVDIRHNAKIGREGLADWAKKQLKL